MEPYIRKLSVFPIETRIRGIVFQINKYRYAVKAQLGNAVSSADLILQFIRVCEEIAYVVASVIEQKRCRVHYRVLPLHKNRCLAISPQRYSPSMCRGKRSNSLCRFCGYEIWNWLRPGKK